MPTILKVNHQYYLVKNQRAAAAVVSALAGAVKLNREYRSRNDSFYPDDDQTEVALMTIRADQLLAHAPDKPTVTVSALRKQLEDECTALRLIG